MMVGCGAVGGIHVDVSPARQQSLRGPHNNRFEPTDAQSLECESLIVSRMAAEEDCQMTTSVPGAILPIARQRRWLGGPPPLGRGRRWRKGLWQGRIFEQPIPDLRGQRADDEAGGR